MKNTLKFKPNYNGNFRGRTVIFPASPSSSLPQNPTAHTPSPYFHFSSSALTLDLPPSCMLAGHQRSRRRPPPPTRLLLFLRFFSSKHSFSAFDLFLAASLSPSFFSFFRQAAAELERRRPRVSSSLPFLVLLLGSLSFKHSDPSSFLFFVFSIVSLRFRQDSRRRRPPTLHTTPESNLGDFTLQIPTLFHSFLASLERKSEWV